PRPQLPLDVALRPLPQILRRDLGEPTEHHYVMKLRALLPLTRLTVLPRFVRRKPNIHHSLPAWYVAHVNVGAQVTHENDFIDSVSHGSHVPSAQAPPPAPPPRSSKTVGLRSP